MTIRLLRASLGCVLFVAAQLATAGPAVVQMWGGTRLTFPAPPAFSDFTAESPQLKSLALATTSPENKLLAFFVSDEAWARNQATGEMRLDRQYRAEVPREFEQKSYSEAQFAPIRSMLRRRYDDQRSAYQKRLNVDIKSSSYVADLERTARRELAKPDFTMKLGEVQVLGVFAEGARYLTAATLTKGASSSGGKTMEATVLSLSSNVLLKDRIVYLYQHSVFRTDEDLKAATASFQSWVDEVLKAQR